jgi:hypothetical protein
MVSFYAFSGELLKKTSFRILAAVLYAVNPVTPYYFVSLFSAFAIVFLPLALKFCVKALKNIDKQASPKTFSFNMGASALFLALSMSAHEQFLPTAAIIAVFIVGTFVVFSFRKLKLTRAFWKTTFANSGLYAGIIALVNLPLLLSLQNIAKASLSTYFMGRFSDFLGNVEYTYENVDLASLLRFGGDSGVGLAKSSWFDVFSYTNLFGYSIFAVIVLSALLLMLSKNKPRVSKWFFCMSLAMFVAAIALILFVKYLPTDRALAEKLFSMPLQTWESPSKLRVLLLLSGLAVTLFAFQKLEAFSKTARRKVVSGLLLALLASSIVAYNSPWLIDYAGSTPAQQVADSKQWGDLYDKEYASLSGAIETSYGDTRGIFLPYTHKAELYLPPNFRLMQLVSAVNDELIKFTQTSSVSWSKLLGLLSTEKVILNVKEIIPDEILIFPKSIDNNFTIVLEEIRGDNGFSTEGSIGSFEVLSNENALPEVYATRYYVLYDNVDTLRYAFDSINFNELPVFIDSGETANELNVPPLCDEAQYEVRALYPQGSSASNISLEVTDSDGDRSLNLQKIGSSKGVDVFSTTANLRAGDSVRAKDSAVWTSAAKLDSLMLESTSHSFGIFSSFKLNFTVNIIKRGEFSFLGPRVMIDVANSTKYFLIFHDTGTVELAAIEDGEWRSSLIVQHLPYDLLNVEKSVNVIVSRTFDEVQVWVEDNLAITFPTDPASASVSISSEESTSIFTEVSVESGNIVKLFATRQFAEQPEVFVQEKGAERSVLRVDSDESDYAIVVQYLNTPLRTLENSNAFPISANILFSGWIVNPENTGSIEWTASIADHSFVLTLTYLSITATWLMVVTVILGPERVRLILSRLRTRFKGKATSERTKHD